MSRGYRAKEGGYCQHVWEGNYIIRAKVEDRDSQYTKAKTTVTTTTVLVPQFSNDIFQHEIMKTVIASNLPFRTIEHAQLHCLLNVFRPRIHIPSATRLQRNIYDYAAEFQGKLKRSLPQHRLLHSATDCWTSPNKLAFMGRTLHYIDKEWQLRQDIIGFQFLGGESHNAVHLANKLTQIIRDLGITNRVLGIVSDNASVNMALAKQLQSNVFGPKWNAVQYRLPCLAHVIALVSNQFMKELKSNPENNDTISSATQIETSMKELQNHALGTFARSVCKVSFVLCTMHL